MKYKSIFLILVFLLSSIAIAQSLEVRNVEIQKNGVTYKKADEDGGKIEVIQNDKLDFYVKLKNDFNLSSKITYVKLMFVSEDLDEMEDYEDYSTELVYGESEKQYILSNIQVPEDADEDTYDSFLAIEYRLNGSDERRYTNISYTLDVTTTASDYIYTKMDNITAYVTKTFDEVSLLSGKLNNTEQLKSCIETRAMYEGQITEKDKAVTDLATAKTTCETNLETAQNEKQNVITERDSVKTQLDDMTSKFQTEEQAKLKAQNDLPMWGFGGALAGAGAFFLWWKKKQKKMNVNERFKEVALNPGDTTATSFRKFMH